MGLKKRVLNERNTSKTRLMLLIMLILSVGLVVINWKVTKIAKEEISIVELKQGLPREGRVREENLKKGVMSRGDYERRGVIERGGKQRSTIVRWEERKEVVGKYAAYYIRESTPLYWDSMGVETPRQYSYLYRMDGELARLELEGDQFGTMLVPGDRINIRVAYTEQKYKLPTEAEFLLQQQLGLQPQTEVDVQEMLFSNTYVLDALNEEQESIFDIYYSILMLPKTKQQEVMQTEEFKAQVVPSTILLKLTPEEADHYMQVKGKSPAYMMTVLPREGGNAITELLNEIATGTARK